MAIDISLDRSRLIHRHPFFGALSMYLVPEEDASCESAWCDGENIGYNPAFWESLSEEGRLFVLAHEVMHAALNHCGDVRMGIRDSLLWNEAGDYVINLLLTASKLTMPTGKNKGLLNQKYKHWETERVYSDLEKEALKHPRCPICGGLHCSSSEGDDEEGGGEGDDKDKKGKKGKDKKGKGSGDKEGKDKQDQGGGGGKKVKPGCCPRCGRPVVLCAGDIRKGKKPASGEEAAKQAGIWTERLVQAAQIAKQMGKLPGCIEEMIKLILYPKLPWWQILNRLVDKNFPDDFCWTVPDRRMLGYDIWIPGLESPRGKVVIALDTSGSMSTQELAEGLAEARAIFGTKKIYQVRIIQCDDGIHMDETVDSEEDVPIKVKGRGGTSFTHVFKRLEDDPPKALVYFTDLEGEFPKKHPEYLVWWVSSRKSGPKPPFGEHLVINGGAADDDEARDAHAKVIEDEL